MKITAVLNLTILVVLATAFVITSCGPINPARQTAYEKANYLEDQQRSDASLVVQIAVAPDGTVLWRARDLSRSEFVYFSSAGTSWTTSHTCGKTRCTDEHQTPNTPE